MKQFENEHCLFCLRPSSPAGEHVLPEWLLKMFPPGDGPYQNYIDDRPVRRRDGQPRQHLSALRVKVPMCSEHNGILDTRFEVGAKPVIRRLFATDGNVVLSPDEAQTAGTWFAKTWLLLAHPSARASHPESLPPSWSLPVDDLYGWMSSDGPVPTGVSLWLTRRDPEHRKDASTRRIPLPTIVADGVELEFQVIRSGLRSLEVSLVYHPGWAIDHPLEREGRAARLWPLGPGRTVDISALPLVSPDNTTWLQGPRVFFAAKAYGRASLDPLSETIEFHPRRGVIQLVTW